MAKRRNRTPNIPEETLERARQQAMGTAEAAAATSTLPSEEPKAASVPVKSRAERRAEMRSSGTVRRAGLQPGEPGRRTRRVEEMSSEMVQEMLANPTKIVTEAELHQQYGFVLTDLRNMFLLAAVLLITLIVLALVFVR